MVSIETFHQHLHRFSVQSIRESIRNATGGTDGVASRALSYLNLKNAYRNVIQIFPDEHSSIPSEVLGSVNTQLENTSHSHFIYLQKKIDELTSM